MSLRYIFLIFAFNSVNASGDKAFTALNAFRNARMSISSSKSGFVARSRSRSALAGPTRFLAAIISMSPPSDPLIRGSRNSLTT